MRGKARVRSLPWHCPLQRRMLSVPTQRALVPALPFWWLKHSAGTSVALALNKLPFRFRLNAVLCSRCRESPGIVHGGGPSCVHGGGPGCVHGGRSSCLHGGRPGCLHGRGSGYVHGRGSSCVHGGRPGRLHGGEPGCMHGARTIVRSLRVLEEDFLQGHATFKRARWVWHGMVWQRSVKVHQWPWASGSSPTCNARHSVST